MILKINICIDPKRKYSFEKLFKIFIIYDQLIKKAINN